MKRLMIAAVALLPLGPLAAAPTVWYDITPSAAVPTASAESSDSLVEERVSTAVAAEATAVDSGTGFGFSNLSRLVTVILKPLALLIK